MKLVFRQVLICILFSFFYIGFIHAAQDVTVKKDNAPVRSDPTEVGKVIDYLQAGDELRISSHPVNGDFYKVRARNGQYGWIHIRHLNLEPPRDLSEEDSPEPERDREYFLAALGGFDFFRPEDLNDIFNFSELNRGYYGGGEFGWFFTKRFSLLFRTEVLIKDVVARETTTQLTYSLSIRSYPIMVGIDFMMIRDFPVRFSLGFYGGAAVATSFSAETLSLPPPNRHIMTDHTFTTMVRGRFLRPIGRLFSIFGDVGYRHLRTSPMNPANNVNGGQVFRTAGVVKTRIIDLSGLTLGLGVSIHF